jgi:YgiT-type zinc finger domain-containing protein
MCGESMRFKTREEVVRLPGGHVTRPHVTHEWVCPECDYFEDADETERG